MDKTNTEGFLRIAEAAKEIKEKYTTVLGMYLNICQSDIPQVKRCFLETELDSTAYTDGKIIHLGLLTLGDLAAYAVENHPELVEDIKTFMIYMNEYLLGHENQHTRSTRSKDFLAAKQQVLYEFLREFIKIRKEKKIIRNERDVDAYIKELQSKGLHVSRPMLEEHAHFIVNSLEDGRIERMRSLKRPGFAKMRRTVRALLWEMQESTAVDDNPVKKLLELENEILAIATSGVYSKGFWAENAGSELYNTVASIFSLVKKAVNSGCCRGIVRPSAEIAKFVAPYLYEVLKNEEDSSSATKGMEAMHKAAGLEDVDQMTGFGKGPVEEETDDGEESNVFDNPDYSIGEEGPDKEDSDKENSDSMECEGESLNPDPMKENDDGEESKKATDSANKKGTKSDSEIDDDRVSDDIDTDYDNKNLNSDSQKDTKLLKTPNKKGITGVDPFDGKGKVEEIDEEELMAELKEIMKDAASKMEGLKGSMKAADEARTRKVGATKTSSIGKFIPQSASKFFPGMKFKEVFREYEPITPMPADLQQRSDTFAATVDELFQNEEAPVIRSMNGGKMDAAGIYKLGMGSIDCFEKDSDTDEFSGCAYFLCDNSGSMGYGLGSKRYYACEAMAVAEAGFSNKMPLKIAAFDYSSGYVIHEVEKNWDEDLPCSGSYNFAIKGRGGSGNADGNSIRIATEELLGRPEEEKMLIVLSDGQPTDGSSNPGEEVRLAVEDARKAGINVVAIYFSNRGISDHERKNFDYMYKKDYIMCRPEEIEGHLTEVLHNFVF